MNSDTEELYRGIVLHGTWDNEIDGELLLMCYTAVFSNHDHQVPPRQRECFDFMTDLLQENAPMKWTVLTNEVTPAKGYVNTESDADYMSTSIVPPTYKARFHRFTFNHIYFW
jgi:hypothetical protein